MSIYPIRIKKWFPPVLKSEHKEEIRDNKFNRQTIRTCLEFMRCHNCGKRVKMRNGWCHHSLPWGYGDVWCNERCLHGKRKNNI